MIFYLHRITKYVNVTLLQRYGRQMDTSFGRNKDQIECEHCVFTKTLLRQVDLISFERYERIMGRYCKNKLLLLFFTKFYTR